MLGGAITSNLVVPVMNVGSNQINNAFYKSFALKMAEMGGQVTYQGNIGWFNPELAKIALDEMLSSVNVDIRFNTEVTNVKTKDNTITYLNINSTTLSAYNYSIYTDNNTISFDNSLILTDSQGRNYEPYSDVLWYFDETFCYTDLAPNIPKSGVFVYNVPADSADYYLSILKAGTDDGYRLYAK